MIRTVAREIYVDDYEDEYLLFKYISDLLKEMPQYGRVVVKVYIESVKKENRHEPRTPPSSDGNTH